MPYYGLGSEEAIFADLYTQVSTITRLKTIDWQRAARMEADQSRYPGVYINYLDVEKTKLLKDLFENVLSVALVAWVWAGDRENLGTLMNTMIDDLEAAVIADPYRDSNAYDTEIRIVATDGGSQHPQGQVIMNLVITFYSED